MRKIPGLAAVLVSLFFLPAISGIAAQMEFAKELRIVRITPEGEDVPAGRQIVIEFNQPVVSLGQMERSAPQIPIAITPTLNCQWRWLNSSALACNLNESGALKPASKYTLIINPGIKTAGGSTLAKAYTHTFVTERPTVSDARVVDWAAAGTPIIELSTSQPVSKQSLEQQLSFVLANQKPVAVIAKQKKLTAEADSDSGDNGHGLENSSGSSAAATKAQDSDQGTQWRILPKAELPLATHVQLHLAPGLVSSWGAEKSVLAKDVLAVTTYPEFKLLGVRCTTNADKTILISQTNPQSAAELCNPLAEVALSFNTPVLRSSVYNQVEFTPSLDHQHKEVWDLDSERSSLKNYYAEQQDYHVWLPAIAAAQHYSLTVKPKSLGFFSRLWTGILGLFSPQSLTDLADEFGRKLASPLTLKFATDHRLPNFEMVYQNAVLEKAVDSEVPLYVNNLTAIRFDYRSLTAAGQQLNQSVKQKIPAVLDKQFAVSLGVRQMLHRASGAIYGRLVTTPAVKKLPASLYTLFAQVTPYQLHVKLGHFNTLIWVTELATGQPVADAKVTIYADVLARLAEPQTILATATTDSQGTAVLPGTQALDPDLSLARQWAEDKPRLLVRVDKAQDMALMPLSYDFMIDTWRVADTNSNVFSDTKQKYGHMLAWGTTAQGIYKVGDTIQYKLYVRDQDNKTLVPAPKSGYTLQIIDPADKVVAEVKDLQLSEYGSYSGEFALPKQAAVGWYTFNLIANFTGKPNAVHAKESDSPNPPLSLTPMRVLVSDFTPAPFKVTNELNGDLFKLGQPISLTTTAKLHSGGAYTEAMARITAILTPKSFSSPNKLAQGFVFDSGPQQHDSQQVYQTIKPLDNKGELQTVFTVAKQKINYGKLMVESAVQDDRGKYIASQAQADYMGVDRWIGLKTSQWVYHAQQPATVQYLVVNERGDPQQGVPVELKFEHQITNVARVKEAGNAYVSNYTSQWQLESSCKGISATTPLNCEFRPNQAGNYRVIATIKDSQGHANSAQIALWVVGKNYVLWNEQSDSYLPVVSEKTAYQVGEMAHFLIKNPYPGAQALITVERFGVMDRFVQTLDSSSPIITFPIKADYLPGFYLSVLVVSPRVEKPLEQGQVDLGKPAFRMGYVAVPVNDPYKQLQVSAKTDKPIYRPGDKVTLQLHAAATTVGMNSQPIELAVAVLDESVFDLLASGRNYFDPYKGFYRLDNLDLQNYSLLTRLVGRQKFEKKGANPGGDGGIDLGIRNFFKFVSYWNPTIHADAHGNASVNFIAPDNLTGWRVLVMAATASDRLGLGETNFKVNRPTEIRSLLPNQVMEGDEFKAGFSVLNRSEHSRSLTISIRATGDVATKMPGSYTQVISLQPYQRASVTMPIKVANLITNAASINGEIRFVAQAGDNSDVDSLELSVPVHKLRTLQTVASYNSTVQDHALESIAFPEQIYPDSGGLSVVFSPSVINSVQGAFNYLRDYPYDCWEQKLSKGVMAAHYQQLKAYFGSSVNWENSASLPEQTLTLAANYQAPNGGMSFYNAQDQYVDPYLSAYTALAFNWLRQDGYTIPALVESKLQAYLLNFLRRDVAPDYYSDSMQATVRAVALAALAGQDKITVGDLQRYLPKLNQMSLFGQAAFMQAVLHTPAAQSMLTGVSKAILAHADQSAGKFIFTEALDTNYQRILSSPLRDNCAILTSFIGFEKTPLGKASLSDIPLKLMSTVMQTRKSQDHWENTQENIFCMQALVDYSRMYENTPPKMTVGVNLNNRPLGEVQFKQLSDKPVTFTHPLQVEDRGRQSSIEISRQGQGRLYYTTVLNYAPLAEYTQAINAGMDIQREYSVQRDGKWLLLKDPLQLKQGELVRVDIYLSLPAARNFVVVDDPVPGGLEPVNRDLATASIVDANQDKFSAAVDSNWFKAKDWIEYNTARWSFYHQELGNHAVRYYADYLLAGNYHLFYTAQAIAVGNFGILPVKAAEMYNPEVFAKGLFGHLVVAAKPSS